MTQPHPALQVDLEDYRDYLGLLARKQLDPRLQGKVDLSGVVQQTLLEATQGLDRLQGMNAQGQAAWLRRVLTNNLRDELRKLHTAAREVDREQSLEAARGESSAGLVDQLAANHSSPSQRASRQEQRLALADALAQLPADQRRAVELHHLQGRSLAEVAHQLGRSKGAVAALLFRGLSRLRGLLADAEGG